jgi:hypothetical protein
MSRASFFQPNGAWPISTLLLLGTKVCDEHYDAVRSAMYRARTHDI